MTVLPRVSGEDHNTTARVPKFTYVARVIMAGIVIVLAGCAGSSSGDLASTSSPTTSPTDASTTTETQSASPSSIGSTTAVANTLGSSSSSTGAPPTTAASPVCSASERPPAGNPFTPVIVSGISVDDPDKGLNIRFDPTTASAVQFALPNGSTFAATGLCEKTVGGNVWWEVENGQWNGWATARFLEPFVAGSSACPAGNYNPIGKGTVESLLGDFDGDGLVDSMHLSYDGVVQPPAMWNGTTANLQIQYADGGLSTELDITGLIGDGGPGVGISQMTAFPQRIDFAGSSISAAVLGSTYSGSATGAGRAHFAFSSNCEPVMLSIEVNPSAGFPQRPVICDVGGGRVDLYALDGVNGAFDFLVTPYEIVVDQLIPQPQIVSGNASSDPDPLVC